MKNKLTVTPATKYELTTCQNQLNVRTYFYSRFAIPNLDSCLSLSCVLAVGICVTIVGKKEMYGTNSLYELDKLEYSFASLQQHLVLF